MSKRYGLILPNKDSGHKIHNLVVRPSIFNDDSDSDNEVVKPTGLKKTVKKQDLLNHEKAVEEDPTVFQYDEIYDEMDKKRKESKLSRKDLDKKPKYISKLLEASERRKRENERRIERQVQKEREAEGEEFKDKESFVTESYKKKLQELQELEEQEKREEYLESIGDVKKQGNLDGFYRHLYDQKVNYEEKVEKHDKVSPDQPDSKRKKNSNDKDNDSDNENKSNKVKKRRYRQRKDTNLSEAIESEEENDIKKEHLPSNLDADSDFSIDSSDSDDVDENNTKKENQVAVNEERAVGEENKILDVKVEETEKEVDAEVKEEPETIKPKIDIWKKRTVGIIFDEALKRYYERKSLRDSNKVL